MRGFLMCLLGRFVSICHFHTKLGRESDGYNGIIRELDVKIRLFAVFSKVFVGQGGI